MKKTICALSLLSLFSCTNMSFKTLSIYNASEKTVFLESIDGIHLFDPGSGPQDFGGKKYPPSHLGRITSYQTVHIDSPIKVTWLSGENKQRQSAKIGSVENLPRNPMDYDGNILLVFETNLTWSASFVEGDTAPPVQILEKMYK